MWTPVPCYSPPVLIDTTPPETGKVILLQRQEHQLLDPLPPSARWQASVYYIQFSVSGFWDPESGVSSFEVQVFKSGNRWPVRPRVKQPVSEYMAYVINMKHLETYYVVFDVLNHAGLRTTVISQPVTIDVTPPVLTAVYDWHVGPAEVDVIGVANPTLVLQWDVYDPESGVVKVEWCLGYFPQVCDVVNWLEVEEPALSRQTAEPLVGLEDNTWYYVTVKVTNGAGSYTVLAADGFVVDLTPPICGYVVDGPGFDVDWIAPSIDYMGFAWWAMADLGSGIVEYAVQVKLANATEEWPSGNHSLWVAEVGLATSAALSTDAIAFEHLLEFKTVVRVTDKMGHFTLCESDGFTVDATPPLPGSVDSAAENTYQTFNHAVEMVWANFIDPESGIHTYHVALGNETHLDAHRPWHNAGSSIDRFFFTGLDLPDGLVTISVRAVNRAGLMTVVTGTLGCALLRCGTRRPCF
jgi:hypothetical protein